MGNPNVVYFAKTNFRGSERTFGIRRHDRRQHTYVIGKTGTGKTNLLKNMAFQDIQNGDGLAIIDPHGSFVEEVLEKIPEHRLDDVIYFNPSDSDYPIGFNVLEVPDPKYKHLVSSDLMGIFTKIWANVWSARMEYILDNCIKALLDTPNTTLLGIPRLLVDKDYRRRIVDNIKDPVVRSFWIHEYEGYTDRLRSEAIAPIQNKVGAFLTTSIIRNIVGQQKSKLHIPDIMNQRKILLVNVAKGRIGEDNSKLLGAMLITKIQLAAMERVRIPEDERKDFYLYVDEFQNFATDSFASILSEARKYRLNLTIAHQYIGQLVSDTTTAVRDAVFGNCGTLLVFRVGASDAEFLENEFAPEFEVQDLVNLPNRNIYVKLMVNGITTRPFSGTTLPAEVPEGVDDSTGLIIEMSRKKYGRARTEVEADIERWSSNLGEESGAAAPAPKLDRPEKSTERYTAKCSVCGKTAHVNFKPDESRPIYCSECLPKVQSGEIPPVKVMTKPTFGESLGSIGIEFANEQRSELHPERHSRRNDNDRRKTAPEIKKGSYAVRQQAGKVISLKELTRTPAQRRGPDMAGLKNALKRALERNPGASGEKPHREMPSSAPLKPGDSIKL